MKILKIENGQGYFATAEGEYETIDKIDKAILSRLVNSALEDGFKIDEYSEIELQNQAHQIIYKSISEKLLDLHQKRRQFRDESDRLYLDAYEKYKS
ncbi:hypothetical protein ACOANN_26870 [Pseudomonas aeruginosa]|uniref:hypothetical protein n=1 Tax=Pseudomonas aeruginosa TaxID=287 RepID=UPI0003B93A31|nr:hypothetical protein [Pseudomonas aeruginosa]EIU7214092.1 hypothetical protein [Pseudomonas aeruginosa]ERY28184.1 hypothetical protein Q066_06488 [Pseudomonas aeruginosa BL12]MCS7663894.1 hypothetical protein [Pseudomonas aeruginosa]TQO72949.1 hypothetical protein EU515_02490 [Pseudomonas aeruginosa]HDU9085781.1 hypothetical protein [Pseudomonas aeruginosa]